MQSLRENNGMQNRILGKSRIAVSEIGLGCWQFGGDFGPVSTNTVNDILDHAVAQGITLWDTADVYGDGHSEWLIGRFIKNLASDKVLPTIITKVGRRPELYPNGYDKVTLHRHISDSINRLGVEQLDLVQLHCIPRSVLEDGEIFHWLESFQRAGLIKNFGASVETVDEGMLCLAQPNLASLQIIFNLFRQAPALELLPAAQATDVGVIVRLPLASGLLTGKFKPETAFAETDHRHYNRDGDAFHVGETFSGLPFGKGLELVEALQGLLPKNATLTDIALRWILDHPAVSTVITGVSKPEQIAANARTSLAPPLSTELHNALTTFYSSQVQQHIRGAM